MLAGGRTHPPHQKQMPLKIRLNTHRVVTDKIQEITLKSSELSLRKALQIWDLSCQPMRHQLTLKKLSEYPAQQRPDQSMPHCQSSEELLTMEKQSN